MRLSRIILVIALALPLLVGTATAGGKGKGKGKKPHGVHGVIVRVDKDKTNATITVRVHNKKGAVAAAPEERTFHVTDLTKFERVLVTGKGKDQRERKPASLRDMEPGQRVLIVPADRAGDARLVAIVQKNKKKA
jgi:hypothetical protein